MIHKIHHFAQLDVRRLLASKDDLRVASFIQPLAQTSADCGRSRANLIFIILGLSSLSACVEVQERRSSSVNGQQVYIQETTTQVSFIPRVGL